MPSQRDVLAAVAGGVAVGLLALAFPSWIALLGIVPAAIACLDFARRRQIQPVGVLLLAAALTAGLPSGLAVLYAWRTPGATLDPATGAIFAAACGALILGVMLLLLVPEVAEAGSPANGAVAEPPPVGDAGVPDDEAAR